MFTFLIMLIWTTVIAHKQNSLIHYQLSGVGRFDVFLDNIFAVPRDRDAVVIDIQLDKDGLESFPDGTIYIHPATPQNSMNQNCDPHGYPIHAHCWSLIERIIGPRAE